MDLMSRDCPFAYILSVVSNMKSKVAIEQLIGRVLSMPYIEEKNKIEHGYGEYKSNTVAKKLANSIAKIIRDESEDILKIIDSVQLNEFIYLVITRLVNNREDIELQALVSKKYQLKRAISKKLKSMIESSKKYSFYKLLETQNFTFSTENMVEFLPNSYVPNPDSRSGEFKKHHYTYVDRLDSQDEYDVAKYIDGELEGVTTWVKNIVKNPQNSFWLQLSNAKFYPDFIIKLANGKTVVAEYKGGHLLTNDDTKEKELVGNLWASQSDDFEFLMLEKGNYREALERVVK